MITVVLHDGTEVEVIMIEGAKIYHQGATRDSLTITLLREGNTLDAVDVLFGNKELTERIIVRSNGEEYAYEDYKIKTQLRTELIEITPGDSNTPPVTEQRIVVTLAQLTYMEKLMEQILGSQG